MSKDSKKNPLNKYIRFTGIALQMGLTIYLGSLLGEWLDQKYPNDSELYTKICTLAAVFGAIYSVIRQVIKITDNNG
ncbi:putative F0F1-ATPase subunit (Ca2+/Mg2+ transporter) [Tenacibaculum lutimaris]|uniref:Putative F0F1-ATPase subunit (Ca2+/Mg2+ transporter) n=1 Tax=Tenacibaculum lutimaris TaxID=285258 RepID=A0A420E4K9_9FLAO|nr:MULTISPECIES: AtpZ/AtpI family protein [Tenacibaculum]MDE0535752.1 AtpZ/AtpI family protein [Tenacibaculum sp. L6]RKF05046.1 putative F0F1-ATPase subunit (Ca2+/Mg2+ transporter) [Tenacibaculum lutimaris]